MIGSRRKGVLLTMHKLRTKFLSCLLCTLLIALPMTTAGCNADSVIKTLDISVSVAGNILVVLQSSGTSPEFVTEAQGLLGNVKDGLTAAKAVYAAYESADAATKPSLLNTLQTTVGSIQTNLTTLLSSAHVKSPETIEYVTLAVAIINSALVTLIAALPNSTVKSQAVVVGTTLPVVVNARTPNDLKKAWNNKVNGKFQMAVIK